MSLSFPLRFFLSTRLLSRGRGAFSFPAFFNRREFGIAKRRGEGRGKVNLSRRVSRYLVLSRECWRNARLGRNLGERDLISRIKNSNNSGGGRSEFHAALRPRVSPGIRKSSAAVTESYDSVLGAERCCVSTINRTNVSLSCAAQLYLITSLLREENGHGFHRAICNSRVVSVVYDENARLGGCFCPDKSTTRLSSPIVLQPSCLFLSRGEIEAIHPA